MNRPRRWMACVVSACCVLGGVHPTSAARFVPLGLLPGLNYSSATGVSDDGLVVVGVGGAANSYVFAGAPFSWTRDGGMVGLGFPGAAVAVSADGSVVVGGMIGGGAFRWARETGVVRIGDGSASDISADGSVVIVNQTDGDVAAYRWTPEVGMVGLGDLPGGHVRSHARSVSADGSVVVGWSSSAAGQQAFRWTIAEGMVGLGEAPGVRENYANAVSADGSVVVGGSNFGGGAFRWTRETGMVRLGQGNAHDVSADGSVVVGARGGLNRNEAFFWDATDGMRSLADLLTARSVDLGGWWLESATAVSADGATIVGSGINPAGLTEAWLANISVVPEPSALASSALALLPLVARRRRCAGLSTPLNQRKRQPALADHLRPQAPLIRKGPT